MKKESYNKMLDRVSSSPGLLIFTTTGGKVLTYVSYVVYPFLVASLFILDEPQPWKGIVVPAAGFLILSVFRYCINAPRPYELFERKPLVTKNTRGKSFPSRHVFSAFIIAFTGAWYYPLLGFILAVCGSLLAVTRVLSGVHFTRDVVAGAISGIGLGLLGFLVL